MADDVDARPSGGAESPNTPESRLDSYRSLITDNSDIDAGSMDARGIADVYIRFNEIAADDMGIETFETNLMVALDCMDIDVASQIAENGSGKPDLKLMQRYVRSIDRFLEKDNLERSEEHYYNRKDFDRALLEMRRDVMQELIALESASSTEDWSEAEVEADRKLREFKESAYVSYEPDQSAIDEKAEEPREEISKIAGSEGLDVNDTFVEDVLRVRGLSASDYSISNVEEGIRTGKITPESVLQEIKFKYGDILKAIQRSESEQLSEREVDEFVKNIGVIENLDIVQARMKRHTGEEQTKPSHTMVEAQYLLANYVQRTCNKFGPELGKRLIENYDDANETSQRTLNMTAALMARDRQERWRISTAA